MKNIKERIRYRENNTPIDNESIVLAGIAGLITAGILTYKNHKASKETEKLVSEMNAKMEELKVKALIAKDTTITSSIKYTRIIQFTDIKGPVNGANILTASHYSIEKHVGNDSEFRHVLDLLKRDLDTMDRNIKEGSTKSVTRILRDNECDTVYIKYGNYDEFTKTAGYIHSLENIYADTFINSKEWIELRDEISMPLIVEYKKLTDRYLDTMKMIADILNSSLSTKIVDKEDIDNTTLQLNTSTNKETFEERFYASLDNGVDAEKYNFGAYPVYEIGDDAPNDVNDVLNMFGKDVSKLKLVRTNIDSSKKLKIINDLVPVYKAHREYVESKKQILDDPNYKAFKDAKVKDDTDVGFERKLGKTELFHTLALWYSDWGEDVQSKLIENIIPILKKHISFDLFLDETVGSDTYLYIVKKDGTVYDLVFDISHDGDSFSLRVVSFDVIESIKSDIEINS